MEAVWKTNFFQHLIEELPINLRSTEAILIISVILSQAISNVPLVALYQPLLLHLDVSTIGFAALAAGSTIAGNMFILGAASNIIIIQNAERRSHATISFWEFSRIGIPLTVIQAVVYWLYLSLF